MIGVPAPFEVSDVLVDHWVVWGREGLEIELDRKLG